MEVGLAQEHGRVLGTLSFPPPNVVQRQEKRDWFNTLTQLVLIFTSYSRDYLASLTL